MQKSDFAFTISRTFDASLERVWKAWTDPKQMQQWYGPKGSEIISSKGEWKPGSTYHYGMKFSGTEMWGKWVFREIKAPEKMVFIVSFTDAGGKEIHIHPMNPNWPREILSTITFKAVGDKTEVTVDWRAYNATAIEQKTFEDGQPSMQQGWGGTLDQLVEYLKG